MRIQITLIKLDSAMASCVAACVDNSNWAGQPKCAGFPPGERLAGHVFQVMPLLYISDIVTTRHDYHHPQDNFWVMAGF